MQHYLGLVFAGIKTFQYTHEEILNNCFMQQSSFTCRVRTPLLHISIQTTKKTREALEKEVTTRIAAAQPTQVAQKPQAAQYIRYTPSQQGLAFNSGAKQRVIRMVEMQKDPMEPPRFKYVGED